MKKYEKGEMESINYGKTLEGLIPEDLFEHAGESLNKSVPQKLGINTKGIEDFRGLTNKYGGDWMLTIGDRMAQQLGEGYLKDILDPKVTQGMVKMLKEVQESTESMINKSKRDVIKVIEKYKENIERDKGRDYYKNVINNVKGIEGGREHPLYVRNIVVNIIGGNWGRTRPKDSGKYGNKTLEIATALDILLDQEDDSDYLDITLYDMVRMESKGKSLEYYNELLGKVGDFYDVVDYYTKDIITSDKENIYHTIPVGDDGMVAMCISIGVVVLVVSGVVVTIIKEKGGVPEVVEDKKLYMGMENNGVSGGISVEEYEKELGKEKERLIKKVKRKSKSTYIPKKMEEEITEDNYLDYSLALYYINNVLNTNGIV